MEEVPRYVSQLYVIPAVDAEQAGKGQLEISVNQGRVPNNVQMQDAGRCLVTFIPQHAGTYVIDVTFNGQQVHGCPIRVDVNSKHIGKPVSAPVVHPQKYSTGGVAVAGSVSPRPPSSAYFSAGSPHIDTSTHSPAGSPYQTRESPRSPSLVAAAAHTRERSADTEDRAARAALRSPRLVHETSAVAGGTTRPLGYTVAHYNDEGAVAQSSPPTAYKQSSTTITTHRYFGDAEDTRQRDSPSQGGRAGESTVDSALGGSSTMSPRPHRYFESTGVDAPPLPNSPPPDVAEEDPTPSSGQFQMTRSAEVRLYHDSADREKTREPGAATLRTQELASFGDGYDYRVTSERRDVEPPPTRGGGSEHRHIEHQVSPRPMGDFPPPSQQHHVEPSVDELKKSRELHAIPLAPHQRPIQEEQRTSGHKKHPSESLTPGTRRKLFEHSVQKSADLKESSIDYNSESEVSKHSSKPTTPRLSFKFNNKDKTRDPNRGFDFGKSKFTSKHEVVRLGKDVEVKLESLKLGKEDHLRVVVTPPSRTKSPEDMSAPDLPHRLKKSGKTHEITFKPTEVGTHKVLAFVNDQPHPLAPFPIRVYDASQIIVGEIVPEAVVNDAVEFTVDAGRAGFGNLELAIKNPDGVIIPSHVSQLESGTAKFLVTFNPTSLGTHSVNITFNKEVIKGSPFEVRVVDSPTHATFVEGAGADIKKKDKSKEKKRDTKKADRNGFHKMQPVVTKLPSLSRVGKPAALLLQVSSETDEVVATVTDSTKQNRPAEIFEETDGLRRIEFVPARVGDHEIHINVNGAEVSGSPFTCRAYDPTRISVGKIPSGAVNRPVQFVVDASDAGVGNLEVAVNDGKIPSMAHALGQHKYEISFVPRENVDHHVSVRFNNEAVPGSPFLCRLSGGAPTSATTITQHQVQVSGAGLERVAVGRAAEFLVELDQRATEGGRDSAATGMPQVIVTDSKSNRLPVAVSRDVQSNEPGRFMVEYTPKTVGNHQVEVLVNGSPVAGSPFSVKAFDASCVRLSLSERARVHKPSNFLIDAAKAGAGNMEIIVSVDGRNVPNFVQAEGQAKFKVSFTPQEARDHVISVKFNGEPIPGSPMTCPVESNEEYTRAPPLPKSPPPIEEELRLVGDLASAQVGQPKRFSIDAPRSNIDCEVIVTGPNGRSVPVDLIQVEDGYDVEFVPPTLGDHKIDIRVDGKSLSICPIICRAIAQKPKSPVAMMQSSSSTEHASHELDLSEVHLIGLRNEVVDVPQHFKLDWSKSGGRAADIKVSFANGKPVPCKMKRVRDGLHECTFTPTMPGLYLIDVFIDGIQLPECPYECEIRDSSAVRVRGDAVHGAQVGRTTHFEVITGSSRHGDLDVLITDPHKSPLPVRCYKQHDESYWVEFTPEQVGTHTVEVTFADSPVPGSPFESEVVDPRQVKVRGLDDRHIVRHIAGVTVAHKNAGNGQLEFEIRDPQGIPLKIDRLKNSADEDQFNFLPIKSGPHAVNLKLAGFPIPGVPATIQVVEKGQIALHGPSIDQGAAVELNQPAIFQLDTRQEIGGLKIDVRDSDGNKVRHSTNKLPDNRTEIVFKPHQVGTYNLNVEFNNKKLTGSPYRLNAVDPRKVLVNDENTNADGSLILVAGERNIIDLDSTAAGPGPIRAEVRDPRGELFSEADARVESPGRGKHRLVVTPRRTGTHKIFLYFADLPVPSAHPLLAHVEQGGGRAQPLLGQGRTPTPKGGRQEVRHTYTSSHSHTTSFESQSTPAASAGHSRIRVYGDGLSRAIFKEPAEFFVDLGQAPRAKVSATLTGDKADIPVRLHPVEGNLYKAIYTPTIGGPYELHILADDRPIQHSPFRVHVQTFNSPAELIEVDARTLKIGILGEDVKTVINAKRATPGHLAAQCEGPSQLEYCELYDNRDGTYILRVTPKELGKHVLSIRYTDEHVPGSPFVFNVSNPPDASKVKVYGPGVDHGILATYNSNFTVETKGAGAGQLTVRVRGPKGAFNVEMRRDPQQDRTIHCKYEPKEPGDYQIEVRWHGVHVPGSPFLVLIVDTEQELQRFLAGGAPSPPPLTPFVPPGLVGPTQMAIGPPPGGIAPPLAGPPLAPTMYGPYGPVPVMPPGKGRRPIGAPPVHARQRY